MIACLEKALDEMLNFMNCPVLHKMKIRTTNVIEGTLQEVRSITRAMSYFTNSKSVNRIIYGLMMTLPLN